jgi:hypothetical protein
LREICDDIVTEDNRAAEVIRRLGALYKRGDMKMEPVDLNALIRETLDLLRGELLIRHVTPITELSPTLLPIDGGSIQLQQVLLNLIINAADAMSEKKVEDRRLTLRTELVDATARLHVIDNGSGIAPDDLPKVFDAFWSTKAGGMGIGLAICQSIVAAHHGRITASNNPNGGVTFSISLPVKAPCMTTHDLHRRRRSRGAEGASACCARKAGRRDVRVCRGLPRRPAEARRLPRAGRDHAGLDGSRCSARSRAGARCRSSSSAATATFRRRCVP